MFAAAIEDEVRECAADVLGDAEGWVMWIDLRAARRESGSVAGAEEAE